MPNNDRIEVKCHMIDCYWNIDRSGGDFSNNCARKEIALSDNRCFRYINFEKAEKLLEEVKQ